MKGWDVKWSVATLSSCCSYDNWAFPSGSVMIDRTEEDGCLRKVEECQVDEGQATVVRTLTKLCCNQEKAVQWFHFKEAATGNLLDFEDGHLKISARNVSRSSQMWRLEGGKMFNKKEAMSRWRWFKGTMTIITTCRWLGLSVKSRIKQ